MSRTLKQIVFLSTLHFSAKECRELMRWVDWYESAERLRCRNRQRFLVLLLKCLSLFFFWLAHRFSMWDFPAVLFWLSTLTFIPRISTYALERRIEECWKTHLDSTRHTESLPPEHQLQPASWAHWFEDRVQRRLDSQFRWAVFLFLISIQVAAICRPLYCQSLAGNLG